jgi:hypothetical protein
MDLPENRKDITNINTNYRKGLAEQLNNMISNISDEELKNMDDETRTEISTITEQKEYFWIRIFLKEEDDKLENGDEMKIKYVPTNEELEMSFGSYEKKGMNRNFDDEVTNYTNETDNKILCCMIDVDRVNKHSEDIPNLRTFFRNSRYYENNLFHKKDIKIVCEDKELEFEYASISF